MPEAIKPIDVEALKALVRTVPDFPKPGILFYDITTLLKDKTGFAKLIDALAAHYIEKKIDLVLTWMQFSLVSALCSSMTFWPQAARWKRPSSW
jgi:adenine/guanine phosphoribosyltransferase-like PRPP-binding protein